MNYPSKKCTDCKIAKNVEEFYKNKQTGKPICRCISCSKIRRTNESDRINSKKETREINLERQRQYQRSRSRNLKFQVINHYSNGNCECCRCKISDIDVLTLDHIDNNGSTHREMISNGRGKRNIGSTAMYRWIMSNGFPSGYSVLCFNCNVKKHLERIRGVS